MGDAWAAYYAFELQQGTEAEQKDVLDRYVRIVDGVKISSGFWCCSCSRSAVVLVVVDPVSIIVVAAYFVLFYHMLVAVAVRDGCHHRFLS